MHGSLAAPSWLNGWGFPIIYPRSSALRGVDASFLGWDRSAPEYDLVYCGAMDGARNLIPWISQIMAGLPGARFLLIGPPSAAIWKAFKAHPSVVFSGRVPYAEVPGLLAKAEYGLNLIPVRYPFHIHLNLKLLEYCAVGLKVITTSTAWVRQFEQQRQGRFFYLGQKDSPLSWEPLRRFPFETPSVDDLVWERLLESSGITALLGRLTG
ncbi:MAG: glycosyltransferase [Haliscomenobacter sp.]|nr:glycosyltransferase [Haliscomenobacter sp.]